MKLLLGIVFVFTTGCLSLVMDKEQIDEMDATAKIKKVDIDETQKDRLSFIGRMLLDADDRQKLIYRLNDAHWAAGIMKEAIRDEIAFEVFRPVRNKVEDSLIQHFASDGHLSLGEASLTVAGVVTAIELLMPDGDFDHVGHIYLPGEMADANKQVRTLNTVDDAYDMVDALVTQRANVAANYINRKAICRAYCSNADLKTAHYRVYELQRTQQEAKYHYIPMNVYVQISTYMLKEMKPVDSNTVAALGFVPKYTAGLGRVLGVSFYTKAHHTLDGDVEVGKNKGKATASVYGMERLNYRYQRDFIKAFTDPAGFFMLGNKSSSNRFLAFKGELYGWGLRNSRQFINHKIDDEP